MVSEGRVSRYSSSTSRAVAFTLAEIGPVWLLWFFLLLYSNRNQWLCLVDAAACESMEVHGNDWTNGVPSIQAELDGQRSGRGLYSQAPRTLFGPSFHQRRYRGSGLSLAARNVSTLGALHYILQHINRFEHYQLDFTQPPSTLNYDIQVTTSHAKKGRVTSLVTSAGPEKSKQKGKRGERLVRWTSSSKQYSAREAKEAFAIWAVQIAVPGTNPCHTPSRVENTRCRGWLSPACYTCVAWNDVMRAAVLLCWEVLMPHWPEEKLPSVAVTIHLAGSLVPVCQAFAERVVPFAWKRSR